MTGHSGHTGKGGFHVPDGFEPIRGYRKFNMLGQWLVGCSYPERWRPGVNEARCMQLAIQPGSQLPNMPLFSDAQLKWPGVGPGKQLLFAEDGHLVPAPGLTYAKCPGIARENHGCGFYARHGAKLEYDGKNPRLTGFPRRITGVVDLWGQIELGAQGVRAQYAQIVALTEYVMPDITRTQIEAKANLVEALRAVTTTGMGSWMLHSHDQKILAAELQLAALHEPEFQWPEVKRNYPDVPVFATEEEMLEAFPVPNLDYLYEEEK